MSAGWLSIKPASVKHPGQYLDKFAPASNQRQEQTGALREIAQLNLDTTVYRMAFQRWEDHWRAQGDRIVCVEGTVRDRLAIGLGAESVLENGLRLQFTYGTPVIPGSSLKGILRRGLPEEHRDNRDGEQRNVEWYLFGGPERNGAARFHDAWWVPDTKPPLIVDVLTPHHQQYMLGNAPPTDFDEPVPVSFLTVQGRFLFVIETPNVGWRDYVKSLLVDVLERDGVGAKRSAGYGVIKF